MGRVFRPEYKYTRPDGAVEVRQLCWYCEWWDSSGRQRRRKVGATKGLAEEVLRKLERDAALEREGLPTLNSARMPLVQLRERYLEGLKGRVVPEHFDGVRSRLKAVIEGTGAHVIRDLTPERVEAYLARMAERVPALAPRTINTHLMAVKSLLAWAVATRVIPYNPLSSVRPRSERVKHRKRRALTEEEVVRLLEVAPGAPLERQRERAKRPIPLKRQAELLLEGERFELVWRILIYTGLRVNELRQLRWDDLDLDGGTLTVRAETAKSGHAATLPMPGHLVRELRAWREKTQGQPGRSVVALPVNLALRLREDLASAGIPYKDAAGRQVDAHALRHTFGTLMSRHTDPKTLQTLMRHSSPNLTFGIYVHVSQGRMREAVEALPEPAVEQARQMAVPIARAG